MGDEDGMKLTRYLFAYLAINSFNRLYQDVLQKGLLLETQLSLARGPTGRVHASD